MKTFQNSLLGCLLLATLLRGSQQLSLPSDSSYQAGVVEHKTAEGTPRERLSINLASYMRILESNDTRDLDILVFPEHVLNNKETATFVPQPSLQISPCVSPDYDTFLVELSCATRSRGIYTVFNIVEKELCANGAGSETWNPCPASGVRLFNTNVVFNRQGVVVSRYRKTHLWRQEYYSMSVLRQPDLATFSTDFGVTFGHFICFDMMFYDPAMRLVKELNVTDFIYPTYWFSELPFLTALQLQEGWAFANDVNLLTADGSKPAGRTTGTGIFAGRLGRLTAGIHEEPTTQLYKARVPKRNVATVEELPVQLTPLYQPQLITRRYTELALYRDYNVDLFSTELLAADFLSVERRLCHDDSGFCCEFALKRLPIGQSGSYAAYRYRLAAYHGNETTILRVDRSEQAVCALFACLDEQLSSCGRIFGKDVEVANQYYFSQMSIKGAFPAAPRRLIMPSTVDGLMLPLPVAQYSWTETEQRNLSSTQVELKLLAPKENLLTFGIWANYYTEINTTHNLDHLQGSQLSTSNSNFNSNSNSGAGALAASALLIASIVGLWGF